MTAGAYDLTTLAMLKDRLDPTGNLGTSQDSYFQNVITEMSAAIEGVVGRLLAARDLWEWTVAPWAGRLLTREYPIITLSGVWSGSGNAFSAQRTSTTGITAARVLVTADRVILRTVASSNGAVTDSTFLFSTYGSVSALVTAIAATSGWTATLINDAESYRLIPGTAEALSQAAQLGYADTLAANAVLRPGSGGISLTGWPVYPWRPQVTASGIVSGPVGGAPLCVGYRAGYESNATPADLQKACIEICAEWIDTYGKQNETPSAEGGSTRFAKNRMAMLDRYRRRAV